MRSFLLVLLNNLLLALDVYRHLLLAQLIEPLILLSLESMQLTYLLPGRVALFVVENEEPVAVGAIGLLIDFEAGFLLRFAELLLHIYARVARLL